MRKADQDYFAALGCFILGLFIVFWVLSLSGCNSNLPAVDVSFWAGDSARDGITRSQENRTISCQDPQFDQYVCLTYTDIRKIFDTMLTCKEWPSLSKAQKKERKNWIEDHPEVLHVLLSSGREASMEPFQP